MCFGDGKARRAAEAAAAEQARQAEIERARLAEEARIAKEEADRRYAEEQARQNKLLEQQRTDAEALRKQLQDQEAFRLSELARIEAERKAERDAELQRQNKERADAEAAAKQRADQLSAYNTDRQRIIDNARSQIEGAFSGYDGGFFDTFANDFIDAQKPQIAQQYDDAKRGATFDFARRGNLRSTAAARAFGRLDQTRAEAEGDLAQQATSAANQFRSSVAAQRANALNSIFGAVNAAPVITADNVGEANDSLRYLSSALSAPVQLASTAGVQAPQLSPLTNIFNTSRSAAPRTNSTSGGSAIYSGSGGGTGRLVA